LFEAVFSKLFIQCIANRKKQFSRIPVDKALEQTVNADAASRQTEIFAFTNSEDARRRWMVTRAMQSQVVVNMFDMADLTCKDDVARTLKI